MLQNYNVKRDGSVFDAETIKKVWAIARPVVGCPGFAQDVCGAVMKLEEYGQTSEFGWEIDHKKPITSGGTDDLGNLQPMHWENNRFKGDNYPYWSCRRKN